MLAKIGEEKKLWIEPCFQTGKVYSSVLLSHSGSIPLNSFVISLKSFSRGCKKSKL